MPSSSGSKHQIAVDIGNSGMRVVPTGADNTFLDDLLRINWPAAGSDQAGNHSATWLTQLDRIVAETPSARWWISSVNRPVTDQLASYLTKQKCEFTLIDYKLLPIEVQVDFPERVGVDRLLAALAAGNCTSADQFVVIQAGSAVTVDLVARHCGTKDGKPNDRLCFLGGAILPGVPMMLRLLGRAADMLPELHASDLVRLPDLPGKNTESAMIAGCSSCLVGGVQHLIHRYQSKANVQSIIVSGGDGPLLAPYLDTPVTVVPHLVLQGIAQLTALASRCH